MPGEMSTQIDTMNQDAASAALQQRLRRVVTMYGSIAKAAAAAGVSASAYKSWIGPRGSEPGLLKMVALAQATGVSLDYLARGAIKTDADFACAIGRGRWVLASEDALPAPQEVATVTPDAPEASPGFSTPCRAALPAHALLLLTSGLALSIVAVVIALIGRLG